MLQQNRGQRNAVSILGSGTARPGPRSPTPDRGPVSGCPGLDRLGAVSARRRRNPTERCTSPTQQCFLCESGSGPEHHRAAARACQRGCFTISDRRGLDLLATREVWDRTVVSVGPRFHPGGLSQDIQRGDRIVGQHVVVQALADRLGHVSHDSPRVVTTRLADFPPRPARCVPVLRVGFTVKRRLKLTDVSAE
jgi:hypothetical protein